MNYNYQLEKKKLFTEEGQEMFIKIRDKAKELLSVAGCFRMGKVMGVVCGDTWQMMACVDRMVELGEIKEVTGDNVAGQHRIFINAQNN